MTETTPALSLGSPRLPTGQADWAAAAARLGPAEAAAATQGDFALAATLPDGRVALAVDRFAAQTLCWRVEGGRLRHAESANALGATEIDPQAVFDYLFFHAIPSPRTIFRDVHRVPPGHCVVAEGSQVTVAPYWQPQFRPDPRPDFGALRDEFREALRAAVQAQLRTGTPACFLSGGTDSSTVTGLIQQVAGSVHTYSIGFDAEGYDEMAFARIAARHFGAQHHEYYVTPQDLVQGIAQVAAAFDQPFGNSSALPAWCCAAQARADGVQRLLAGDGGDELFGGNARYATQQLYGHYARVPAALRRGLIEPLLRLPGAEHVRLLRRGGNYVRDAQVPLPDRLQLYNLLLRQGLDTVLTPGFRAAVQPQLPEQLQREVWARAEADNDVDRMLAFDWRYTLAESDLPKVRGACRLAGVDVGFPLLDERLLALSLRLPPSYKLRRSRLRWFFKEALRDFLPAEIIAKQKKGFGLPFGVWALRDPGLRALAEDSVRSFATRGVVRPAYVRTLLEELLPAHPGYYGEMVWILMMLEQWLRVHAPRWTMDS
ncbi:MAG: asparagine synthase [Rubrivivax sp.]|nr:asparagine synthase [Rubrivivax sp.]